MAGTLALGGQAKASIRYLFIQVRHNSYSNSVRLSWPSASFTRGQQQICLAHRYAVQAANAGQHQIERL